MGDTAKTAVVTGALGQDGRLLSESLLAAGHSVVGLVRPERLAEAPAQTASCRYAAVDFADGAAVAGFIAAVAPDWVFHVAAVHHASDVPLTANARLWQGMTTVNFLATTHLIQAILAHAPQCRLVYAASSQMYRPDAGAHRTIDETSHRDPPTWYGMTKSWSADAIRFARERHGLHGSTAILFNHESPYRPESFVSRKISVTAARIALGLEDGLHLRNIGALADWCDAAGAVDAMIRMAQADTPDDYIVGSGQLVPVRAMVEAAFAAAGLDWTRYVTWDADDARPSLRADGTKIKQQLGWTAQASIADVVRRMTDTDLAILREAS